MLEFQVIKIALDPNITCLSGLPDSGFYPEISGCFEADGIFLGNFFLVKNLGKHLGNSQEKFK